MSAPTFLADARGRLLPASIPLRFFGAAAVFHLLAWLAVLAAAPVWPHAPAAPGWALAALHLVTLGVLAMTALGAGTQLLPVATRQGVPPASWVAAIWWLFTPGVALLALGMGLLRPTLLAAGTAAATLALVAWAVLMARNLLGARGMPGVVTHAWAALAALGVAIVAAWALVAGWLGHDAGDRAMWLGLHGIAAPFGFMGALALGFAYILVPMFAIAEAPPERWQLGSAVLVLAALAVALPAAAGVAPAVAWLLGLGAGAAGVAWHLVAMRRTLAQGMRRDLGRSFALVRLGWVGLGASLALGAALAAGRTWPWLPAALGLATIGVWLLSYVLGLLQRIVPFLAAMHGGSGRRAPTPGALTHDGALRLHFGCHVAALALLALAVAFAEPWLVRAAAVVGAAGAAAFLRFFVVVLQRRHAARSRAA